MKKTISLIILFMIPIIIYSQNPCSGVPTITYAGQTYNTVQIGSQCWLKENLNVGTIIPGNLDQSDNGTIEKYCYNDSTINCDKYGGLYQWAEAVQYENGATNSTSPNPSFTANVQGICPNGWHIPSIGEFFTLNKIVNDNGNALKSIGQGVITNNMDGRGTNTSGFSALLTGSYDMNKNFEGLGNYTDFWSTLDPDINIVYILSLDKFNYNTDLYDFFAVKVYGVSVRCIKDDSNTDVEGANAKRLPIEYSVSQNFPNPFNPTTVISYQLPAYSHVKLKLYDLLGREVAILIDQEKAPGKYEVIFNAQNLSSGIYFYRMESGSFSQTKKLLLLK